MTICFKIYKNMQNIPYYKPLLAITILALSGFTYNYYFADLLIIEKLRNQSLIAGLFDFKIYILFVSVYIIFNLFLVPMVFMSLVGGYIFGFHTAVFLNLAGASLGAILSFMLSRYLLKDFLIQVFSNQSKLIVNKVNTMGWKFIAICRLTPIIPFDMINYGLGLTTMNPVYYFVVNTFFILPGAIFYAYLGSLGEGVMQSIPENFLLKSLIMGVVIGVLLWFFAKKMMLIWHKVFKYNHL